MGVHYVGQVHVPDSPVQDLFEYLTEGRLSWNAMPDVYDRVNIDGLRFDYVSGREPLRDALVRTFPGALVTASAMLRRNMFGEVSRTARLTTDDYLPRTLELTCPTKTRVTTSTCSPQNPHDPSPGAHELVPGAAGDIEHEEGER